MATRTVVCPDCDAPLAPGRLSCSSCGALVASVASKSRPLLPTEFTAAAPVLEGMPADVGTPELGMESSNGVRHPDAIVAVDPDEAPLEIDPDAPRRSAGEPEASVEHDATKDAATADTGAAVPSWPTEPPAPRWMARDAGPMWSSQPEPEPEPAADGAALGVAPPTPAPPVPAATPPGAAPTWPAQPGWPPAPGASAMLPSGPELVRNPAGAYLPPSAVLPPAEALPLPGTKPATGNGIGAGDARPSTAGLASIQLGISPRAPSLAIAGGAGVAILGFLLPWADYVLGAASMGGYFDRWGLAGPGHPFVLVLVVGLAGLALVAERLPRWAQPRIPGVAIACLLLGLAWPYLFGPYNASLGLFFVTIGAVVIIVGGLLDLAMSRHSDTPASV